jgi:hypothetical protein
MAEQVKSETKKSFLKEILRGSLKTLKNTVRLLGLIAFLLVAPYVISVVINFFKLVIFGNLNMSDFIVDLEANGISKITDFYLGIVEGVSSLTYRLTH